MAGIALARAGKDAAPAVKELTAALDDADDTVKFYAIQALGRIGAGERRDRLARENHPHRVGTVRPRGGQHPGEHGQGRGRAAHDAAHRGRPAHSLPGGYRPGPPRAGGRLGRPRPGQGAGGRQLPRPPAAADAILLSRAPAREVLDGLVKALEHETDPDVCRSLSLALGKLGKEAVPAIIKALGSENADARFHAAVAARELRSSAEPAVRALVERLKDTDLEVRSVAASALARVGARPSLP